MVLCLINFGKFSAIIISNISPPSLFLFSFWYSTFCANYAFWNYSTRVGCSVPFYSFFFFCILVWEVSIEKSNSLSLFFAIPSLLKHSPKVFYISIIELWILAFDFNYFLEFASFRLQFPSAVAHCLPFPLRLSIAIIVILNSIKSFQTLCHIWVLFWSLGCLLGFLLFLFCLFLLAFQHIWKFFCWWPDMMSHVRRPVLRFIVCFYVNFTINWAVFQVYYNYRC